LAKTPSPKPRSSKAGSSRRLTACPGQRPGDARKRLTFPIQLKPVAEFMSNPS